MSALREFCGDKTAADKNAILAEGLIGGAIGGSKNKRRGGDYGQGVARGATSGIGLMSGAGLGGGVGGFGGAALGSLIGRLAGGDAGEMIGTGLGGLTGAATGGTLGGIGGYRVGRGFGHRVFGEDEKDRIDGERQAAREAKRALKAELAAARKAGG